MDNKKTMTLEQENASKLIAELMSDKIDQPYYLFTWLKSDNKTGWCLVSSMQFHSSWEWQIAVWQKLFQLDDERRDTNPSVLNNCYQNFCTGITEGITPQQAFPYLIEAVKWSIAQPLTKSQAIRAMKKGKKVSHRYFNEGEYIRMEGNKYITEEGYACTPDEFWKHRTLSQYETDWSIVIE